MRSGFLLHRPWVSLAGKPAALSALVRALGDPYPDNQRSASNALWGIDPQALERFDARASGAGKNVE